MQRSFNAGLMAVALALFVVASGSPANAQSGLAAEGRDDLLKSAFLEAFKETLPGGKIIADASDWVIDPLVDASTTTGTADEKVSAWIKALVKSGVTAAWPAYGLQVAGGKIILGTAVFTVESMIDATQDQQVRAILTGRGTGGFLDRQNNPAADTPFMELPLVEQRGITIDNLGVKVQSEAELKELWRAYEVQLRSLYGRANAQLMLDAAWPALLRLWSAQRAELATAEMTLRLDRAMAQAQKRVEAEAGRKTPSGISGTWHLVCCSERYKMDVFLEQDGNGTITGRFADGSSVTGTISGGTVRLHRDMGWGKQDYTLSLSGNVMNGTFTGDRDTSVGVETTMTRK